MLIDRFYDALVTIYNNQTLIIVKVTLAALSKKIIQFVKINV